MNIRGYNLKLLDIVQTRDLVRACEFYCRGAFFEHAAGGALIYPTMLESPFISDSKDDKEKVVIHVSHFSSNISPADAYNEVRLRSSIDYGPVDKEEDWTELLSEYSEVRYSKENVERDREFFMVGTIQSILIQSSLFNVILRVESNAMIRGIVTDYV